MPTTSLPDPGRLAAMGVAIPRVKRRHLLLAVGASLVAAAAGVALLAGLGPARPPVEIAPGLFGVAVDKVWIYAARSGDGAVLFDAGPDPDPRSSEALLQAVGVPRERVRHLFLTHGHSNHVAGATAFPAARVWGGAADADLFTGKRRPKDLSLRLLRWLAPRPAVVVTDALERWTTIDLPGGEVVAFPMPGHTPGSFGFLRDRTLFVGDALHLEGGRFVHTTRFMGRDEDGTRRSIEALMEAARTLDFDRVCTGHGGCTPPGRGRELLEAFASK